MRRIVIPTLMLLIGCAAGVAVREVVVPARAQGQAGPNYEYSVVKGFDADQNLPKYGQEGWRLVAVTSDNNGYKYLYFEREKAR